MHQPTKVTQRIWYMEPSQIEAISVTYGSKQSHQSQHNHGLKGQTSLGRIIGRSTDKIRGIKQIITLRGGRVLESFHHSPFSVVAALLPPAQQMAKRSHISTDEASKYTGVSPKSNPEGKRVLALASAQHQKSSPLISVQERRKPISRSRRIQLRHWATDGFPRCPGTRRPVANGSAIWWPKPGESRPDIGWPIAFPSSYQESRSHGIRSFRFFLDDKNRMHRRQLDAPSPIFPMRKPPETDCSLYWRRWGREKKFRLSASSLFRTWWQRWKNTSRTLSLGNRLPNSDPNVNAEEWLGQLRLGSNRVRLEMCWHKHDNDTPASEYQSYLRSLLKTNSNPEVFKNVSEIPHGWTKVIYNLSSQQFFDQIMLNCLIAGGTGSKEGRQACYVSAAHPQESTAVPDRKSWLPRPFTTSDIPTHVSNWYGQSTRDWSRMLPHVQFCCCSPRRCIARVVGHDQTILYARPSESRTARTGNPRLFQCIGWPIAWPRSTTEKAWSHQVLW